MTIFPNIYDFLIGATAASISKTMVAPLERTQSQNKKINKNFQSIVQCLIRIYREEGFISLWKSNFVNIIRYTLTQALTFTFKEYLRESIKHKINFKNNELIKNIIIGGFAGSTSALIVYPLDYSRTRLAVDINKNIGDRQFSGVIDCMRKTVYLDGYRGLYIGWQISILSLFIYRGLYFGIYDTGKQKIKPFLSKFLKQDQNSFRYSQLICKFLWAQSSVIFAQMIAYPGDTIKRKMMMQSAQSEKDYKSITDCILTVKQKYGIFAFWKGFAANIMTGLGTSLCLVLYDQIKDLLLKRKTQYENCQYCIFRFLYLQKSKNQKLIKIQQQNSKIVKQYNKNINDQEYLRQLSS